MNTKILWLCGGFALLVVCCVTYVLFASPEPGAQDPPRVAPARPAATSDPQARDTSGAEAQPSQSIPAQYVAYSPQAVASDTREKVLFFYADWCPKCRALDADIQQQLGSLSNITIYKVDYDTETALRKQYDVTLQTTLVKTDKDGNKLASYVAYEDPTLAAVRRELGL